MPNASGFVRRSQVFAGNVCEHDTLAEMLDTLDAPRTAVVVMDRGLATADRLHWLREQGYRSLIGPIGTKPPCGVPTSPRPTSKRCSGH